MTKKCRKCGVTKPQLDFEKTKYGYRTRCLECRRTYNRERGRKKERKEYVAAWQRRRSRENYQKLWDYLKLHPCVLCAEGDPLVLDFDHVRGEKHRNISRLAHVGSSWALIEEELQKCQVLCANCHRRKTAKQLNWKSYIIP